ncbi:hypothetical protein CDD81_33 [Ophiocordyceps australis]|uniref:Mitochondrial outer membrane protein OM14 C-terminal domain-containing protein n=1 Tax=Ophiocordyceps australis TaxID=1399860 RepID=A0A2C5YIG6_9HYPO|nr:hypothetical protein CDD81_33 [Ophiocordyceps australis]
MLHLMPSPCRKLTRSVSYADVAASGPRQSAKEAAAPPPPEVVSTESASTASLIDVDMPSVHTVSSDFLEQDVKTETQAHRREREDAAREAKAAREQAAKDATAKRDTSQSLGERIAALYDSSAGALFLANMVTFVGLSSYFGYKGFGLYQQGRLDWKAAGTGLAILAAVGIAPSACDSLLSKKKRNP